MMVPSAAPLILLYRQGSSGPDTVKLTAGYVLVWALAGVPAYLAHAQLPMTVGPIALAAAGFYQLTPLKTACLHHCRTPADFLVQRWGRGPLRLGIEHGAWCLGCCWALMIVLVTVGSMGLAWVVGVAALVAVEKLTRRGVLWARLSGVALLLAAILRGMRIWTGGSMEMS
jgi:predicted metal-binding membrane protein